MIRVRLEVVNGEQSGTTVELTGISRIGRGEDCKLQLSDPKVSRQHAVVLPEADVMVIQDLNSSTGTQVNGVRTRRASLRDGDLITLGDTEIRVRMESVKLGDSGEIPASDVDIVSSRYTPTTRFTLDAVRFRLDDLELEGMQQPDPGAAEAPHEGERRLAELVGASIDATRTQDPDRLVRETSARLLRIFPSARRVGVFDLVEHSVNNKIEPRFVVDRQARPGTDRVRISESVLRSAIRERRSILSGDAANDPRLAAMRADDTIDASSIMCVPLIVGDRVLGALYLDSPPDAAAFDEGDLRLLTGVAAVLAAAFENQSLFRRVQAEAARRANLERYFAPALVSRVLAGEVPLARQGRSAHGTILFVDIRGFTRMTDETPPATLVEMLNVYFSSLQQIIFRSRGTVERFGGDSILAYWGIVEQDTQSELNGTCAALTMLAEVHRLNPEFVRQGRPPLRIGVGVNSGPVVVGDVGGPERYEFTILGSAINLAQRLESMAQAGELIVGSETVQALGRRALHVPLPPTYVKGKDAAVAVSALYGIELEQDKGTRGFQLSLPGTLVLGGATEICLITTLWLGPKGVVLGILSSLQALDGTPARIAFRLPRSERAFTCEGRLQGPGGEGVGEETMQQSRVGLGTKAPSSGEMQAARIQLDQSNGQALAEFLGLIPRNL
ncbi:MAG: FHA domain-containing protein [Planctomycetes bacterium]|nr:FHA domain-containing protein [Planctomycetota bacterium]